MTVTDFFERIETGKDATIICVRTFYVTKTEDKPEGEVIFDGLVNVTSALTSSQGFLQATTFAASGTVKAKGKWEVTDDDEARVIYDPQSVVAEFSPETVLLPNAPFSDSDSIAQTYKATIARVVTERIQNIFATKGAAVFELDDIEMAKDKQSFICEVNDKKYNIRKQTSK